jgi:hypothetical protein
LIGQTITLTTTDGHVLTGRVVYSSPDRLILVYPAGMHTVYRRAITEIKEGERQ